MVGVGRAWGGAPACALGGVVVVFCVVFCVVFRCVWRVWCSVLCVFCVVWCVLAFWGVCGGWG